MRYQIREIDKDSIRQNVLDFRVKIYICNTSKVILDELNGVISGGVYSIDSDSDIRRTFSASIRLDTERNIEDKLLNWIGYYYNLQVGIFNIRLNEYIYYPCGYYTITEASTQYDESTNTLVLSLSDRMADLNGTRNGQIGGAPTIEIPVEYNDTKNIIRNALISILKQQANITDYIISDIGTYYGLAERNPDYQEYRENNPDWNVIPYDLTFNVGCTILDIVNTIRDLYPNYQTYFDVYMNFCCDMIPSSEQDPIILNNDYIQSILMATSTEQVNYDISVIKNVTEVFGQTYEVDRYSTICTMETNKYICTLPEYTKYNDGDYIAFKAPSNNISQSQFQVNTLSPLPIYDEVTNNYIDVDTIVADKIYALQYKKRNGDNSCFYFLGQTQPHAMCILTSDKNDTKYTKEYFKTNYNCENIYMRELTGSPFAIQRLGVILDVKTGDNFDNIKSDSVALENAKYYNAKSAIMTDTVTISTKCIPFLDVQQKIEYKKNNEDLSKIYVIKSISNDFDNGTSTITLYRFCPLYE